MTTDPIVDYMALIRSFLRQEIPLTEFQDRYFKKFKEDGRHSGGQVFPVLDELFGDLDALGVDATVSRESSSGRPGWYWAGLEFRQRAKVALGRLEALSRSVSS